MSWCHIKLLIWSQRHVNSASPIALRFTLSYENSFPVLRTLLLFLPAPGQSLLSQYDLGSAVVWSPSPAASSTQASLSHCGSFSQKKLLSFPQTCRISVSVKCCHWPFPFSWIPLLQYLSIFIWPSFRQESLFFLSTKAHWQASAPAILAFICILTLSTWTTRVCIYLWIHHGSKHPVKLCYTPPHISNFCNNIVFSGCYSECCLAGPWPL